MQYGHPDLREDKRNGEWLLHRCLQLKDHLDSTFCEMQGRLGVPYSSPNQKPFWSALDSSIPSDLFPGAVEYPCLTCAESHLLWWTTYILLYPLIGQLLIFVGRSQSKIFFNMWDIPSASTAGIPSYAIRISEILDDFLGVADHYAGLICRSAQFLVQSETKAMGAQILLAPFSQATQFIIVEKTPRNIDGVNQSSWCFPFGIWNCTISIRHMIWPKYEAATNKRLTESS